MKVSSSYILSAMLYIPLFSIILFSFHHFQKSNLYMMRVSCEKVLSLSHFHSYTLLSFSDRYEYDPPEIPFEGTSLASFLSSVVGMEDSFVGKDGKSFLDSIVFLFVCLRISNLMTDEVPIHLPESTSARVSAK